MSIKKYTNFEQIDSKVENKGQFLQKDDLFIVSKTEIEETDFGDCKYDVMEVSVYDVNSNLLPNKSGNNVAYIKTGDIKNYLYNLTNKGGQQELAIDAEKLLKELGFTNGILKLNLNFVRTKVGTDDSLTRVWIQEISPSREEIRILPLKTKDNTINQLTNKEFKNIHNLSKDFKYYKKNILTSLDAFEFSSLTTIDDALVNKFGNDFKSTLKKDFGLTDLDAFRDRIFKDFKNSVTYWVSNKYYDVTQSNFGKQSEIRFIDCDQYDFNFLLAEIRNILNNCISANTKTLKRRVVEYKEVPQEFAVVELRKQIQDNLERFQTRVEIKRNVYAPDKVDIGVRGVRDLPPIIKTIDRVVTIEPVVIDRPTPAPIIPTPEPQPEPTPQPFPEPTPNPKIEQPEPFIEQPTPFIEQPAYSGGGGGGGGRDFYETGRAFGGDTDIVDRESIQNLL
jgi:hypothetical protein